MRRLLVVLALAVAPTAALAQAPASVPAAATIEQPAAAQSAAPAAAPAAPEAAAAPAAAPTAFPADELKGTRGLGQPDGRMGLQEMVTEIGQDGRWMHDVLLLPIITIISLFVLGLLLWVVVRYRAAANPTPSRTSHNTLIEVIWTLAPVLILVAIAVPSFRLLSKQYSPPAADLTVKVTGHQWYWTYEYPDAGELSFDSVILSDADAKRRGDPRLLGVDNRMIVPVNKVVKVLVTADDVLHSFAMPAFWVKIDAVPGRINETWFKADRVGVFYGQCSELCGTKHGFMPIVIEVVPQERYDRWLAAKQAAAGITPPAPGAAPAPTAAATTANKGNQA